MSWRERARSIVGNVATPELTKPTKAPSVSFGSAPSRPISEIEGANEPLPDPAMEARRQRVLELLAANPSARYALATDAEADPVILALAIRGQATCELRIPRDKYDGFLLLKLIERHGGTVH